MCTWNQLFHCRESFPVVILYKSLQVWSSIFPYFLTIYNILTIYSFNKFLIFFIIIVQCKYPILTKSPSSLAVFHFANGTQVAGNTSGNFLLVFHDSDWSKMDSSGFFQKNLFLARGKPILFLNGKFQK
ncbi:MAG: beta-1,4-endo-glucanase [Uewvirus yahnais]|uniref:Beta-1,4-endo-glucanase n=1 Tax=Cressdnaviricota sp. TaxID=2748378 RepID=A0A345MW34_9VIRU|nr:MAG: beta-1,4-endo-glucanase [Cressdnaviricota sp.]